MNRRAIFAFLILLCILAPVAAQNGDDAQPHEGWSIEIQQPFYFVGESVNGTVYGYANMNYSLYLVNKSANWTGLHLTTGSTGPLGRCQFDVELMEEWVSAGEYSLNVTVDGYVMCFTDITVDYSAEFLHQKEHDWINDMLAWLERAVNGLVGDVNSIWAHMGILERAVTFLFMAFIIVLGQVLLHVMAPRFYAWAQYKQQRTWYKRRQIGIKNNTRRWHRKEPEALPASARPNLARMAENLWDIDMPPEMAAAVVWEGTGNLGHGDYVRDEIRRAKRSRMGKRAKWRLQRVNEKNAELLYGQYLEGELAEVKKHNEELRKAYERLEKAVAEKTPRARLSLPKFGRSKA